MRTMDSVQRALEDAKLAPTPDRQGGAGRRHDCARRWCRACSKIGSGSRRIRKSTPICASPWGRRIQAALIAGEDVGAVLVDITPHSLGIRCLSITCTAWTSPFRFAPIIRRNTPLPGSRSEMLLDRRTTIRKKSRSRSIKAKTTTFASTTGIGNFRIAGLAYVPAGNQLVVQCDLNLDGMLKVSAKEKATGLQKHVTIENALSRFEGSEITEARDRLDRLWGESVPADAAELEKRRKTTSWTDDDSDMPELVPGPREGQRETVQASALLEKAERLLEKVPAGGQGGAGTDAQCRAQRRHRSAMGTGDEGVQ